MYKLLAVFVMVACCGKQVYLQAASSNHFAVVYPKNYKLSLKVYFGENPEKNFVFEGSVVITINVKQPVKYITLDAEKLIIDRSSLQAQDGTVVADYELQPEKNGSFNITMINKVLMSGLYYLTIDYTGKVNKRQRKGLYSGLYTSANSTQTLFMATNFKAGHARSVFPCFEDPRFKATFELTIKNNKKYTALSNMKPKYISVDNKMTTTVFETTPAIPTQLLAIVVSNLKSIVNKAKNFAVYIPEDHFTYARFTFEKGIEIMNKYKELADIDSNSSKIDIVYVPYNVPSIRSFNFIFTEGRDPALGNEQQTTLQKHEITRNLAYELAIQWFGHNLYVRTFVDVWNLQNIANFLSYYVIDQIEPSWHLLNRFIVGNEQSIDFSDSKSSIASYKGVAALHMMEYVLTKPIFFKGLKNYLNKAYNTAVDSNDFFASMQEVANAENFKFDVKKMFESWMNLDSFPVLNVTRDYNSKTAYLEQKSYKKGVKDNSVWSIPITYMSSKKLTAESTKQIDWLTESSNSIRTDVDYDDWILIDNQGVGYYRVIYDKRNLELITQYLKSANRDKIPVLKRAQLISDALVLTQEKLLDLDVLLTLTSYLEKETDYLAWIPGLKALQWLNSQLNDTNYYPVYKKYVSAITSCALKSVGISESEKDNDISRIFRSSLIGFLCSIGDTYCIDKMHKSLFKWLQNPSKNAISADMKSNVLCYGLRNAGMTTWNKTIKIDRTFTLENALSCSANKEILIKYFNDTGAGKIILTTKYDTLGAYSSNIDLFLELVNVLLAMPDEAEDPVINREIIMVYVRRMSSFFTKESQLKTLIEMNLIHMKSNYEEKVKQAIQKHTAWSIENGQNFNNTITTVSATLFAHKNECKL